MNYFKVVDPLFSEKIIDTKEVNYSLTLTNWDRYFALLDFVTHSSLDLNLPLDFYFTIYNQLSIWGDAYLQSFPKSENGIFALSMIVNTRYDQEYFIKENELIKIILKLDEIGISYFAEGNYLWESIFEQVRSEKYRDMPSRSSCLFLFGSVEDCHYYIQRHNKFGIIRQVDLIDTKFIFKADMKLLDGVPSHYTCKQARTQADNYWSGKMSERPVFEFLFQGNCKIGAKS